MTNKLKSKWFFGVALIAIGAGLYAFNQTGSVDMSSTAAERNVAQSAKTVCSVTINSDDEIKAFKANLAASGNYRFVELIKEEANDWFDQACNSGVSCDVLLISGHYGGHFFSLDKSKQVLTMSDLEKKSCAHTCKGILENPKEVYLFGCNTLAGKAETAGRTMEQYIQVLVEDGFSHDEAERVAEGRYGPAGDQTVNRMKRVFPGVPAVYGFCDKAPLGAEAGPIMKRYFSSVGGAQGYSEFLDKLETIKRESNEIYTSAIAEQLSNKLLAGVFPKHRCFAQVTGVDKNDDTAKRLCIIRNEQELIRTRVENLNFLLHSDQKLGYIELCNDFLAEMKKKTLTPDEAQAVDTLKHNDSLKREIIQLLPGLKFLMAYDFGVMAVSLGADKGLVKRALTTQFLNIIKKGLSPSDYTMMLRQDAKYKISDYLDINYSSELEGDSVWKNEFSVAGLGFTGTKDRRIIDRIQSVLEKEQGGLRYRAGEALGRLGAVDASNAPLYVNLINDPTSKGRSIAYEALTTAKYIDDNILSAIENSLVKETDNWSKKKAMLYFLYVTERSPRMYALLTKILSQDPLFEARQYAALALARYPISERYVLEALVNGLQDSNTAVQTNCRIALRTSAANIPQDLQRTIQSRFPTEYQLIFKK